MFILDDVQIYRKDLYFPLRSVKIKVSFFYPYPPMIHYGKEVVVRLGRTRDSSQSRYTYLHDTVLSEKVSHELKASMHEQA